MIRGSEGYAFAISGKIDGSSRGDAATQVMGGLVGAALHANPRRALVIGLGTGSTAGSVISTWAVGRTLDITHSYVPVFVGIGLLMPVALLVGTLLMGRVEPLPDPVAK